MNFLFNALFFFFTVGAFYFYCRWSLNRRRPLSRQQAVVITGCDSGLGYSLAIHCFDEGATVIAGVLERYSNSAGILSNHGIRVLNLDITKEDSVANFYDQVAKIIHDESLEFRGLVNNAGVMIFGEFEWQTLKQQRQQVEVNILGTMSITKQLMPLIRYHKARIVNVTSHCALASLPGLAVYGATKAALRAWTDSLRVELAKYDVSVVNFVPGSFATQSNIFSQQSRHFDEMRANMTEEAREFYSDYFDRYAAYLSALKNDNESIPVRLQIPEIYKTFDAALLNKRPAAMYKCEPWRYTYYHALFRVTPTSIRDWLVKKFVKMPSWES